MISTLLILILERTHFIALLKSLGAQTRSIRKIFIYLAANLLGRGLLIGNIIGIGLCYLQLKTGILTLPEESYYLSVVPINFDLQSILFLNIITFIVCIVMMIIPSLIIARISPVRALHFK